MSPLTRAVLTVVGILLAVYAATCALRPYADCWRCHGTGAHRALITGARTHCRRCDGTGDRIRLGRRAWNRLARARRDAQQ